MSLKIVFFKANDPITFSSRFGTLLPNQIQLMTYRHIDRYRKMLANTVLPRPEGIPQLPQLRRFQAAVVKGSCSFARDCKDLQKSAHSARAAANSFRSASSKSWENGIDPVATNDPMGLR